MKFNSDFEYDLEVGKVAEKKLARILEKEKIEVKTDLKAKKTGNIFIEFESREKPSGIATTKAKWWFNWIDEDIGILIKTDILKEKLRELVKNDDSAIRSGGDCNTSKGIVISKSTLIK